MHSRVRYVQSGGIAGLRVVAEIDTGDEAAETAKSVGAGSVGVSTDSVDLERLIDAALKEHAGRVANDGDAKAGPVAAKTARGAKGAKAGPPVVGGALPSMAQMPDALHYEVTITRGGKTTRITTAEHDPNSALGALITAVKPHGQPSRSR